MRLLVIILLSACTPASWSKTDTALEATFATTLAADYLQTRQITSDGMESNPIMGERGEKLPPAVYFPTVAVAHLAVTRCLPRPWRTVFQGVSIGWQAETVRNNWRAGYAVDW